MITLTSAALIALTLALIFVLIRQFHAHALVSRHFKRYDEIIKKSGPVFDEVALRTYYMQADAELDAAAKYQRRIQSGRIWATVLIVAIACVFVTEL